MKKEIWSVRLCGCRIKLHSWFYDSTVTTNSFRVYIRLFYDAIFSMPTAKFNVLRRAPG